MARDRGRGLAIAIGMLVVTAVGLVVMLRRERCEPERAPSPAPESAPPAAAAPAQRRGAPSPPEEPAPAVRALERLEPGVIHGTVLLEEDGSPVPDVLVEAWETRASDVARSRTDQVGRFRIEIQKPATIHSLRVDAGPQTAALLERVHLRVRPGEERRVELLVSRGATLQGRVVDTHQTPVTDATVLAWCRDRASVDSSFGADPDRVVRVDELGRFHVAAVGPQFLLTAIAPGRICLGRLYGDLVPGQEAPPVTLVLGDAHAIHGRVLAPDGSAVADQEVVAYNYWPIMTSRSDESFLSDAQSGLGGIHRASDHPWVRTRTRADGTFVLEPLAPVPYRIKVEHPTYPTWEEEHFPTGDFLTITLSAGASITGTVTHHDGRPASGASVKAVSSGAVRRVACDEQGRFEVRGLSTEGDARLHVEAPGAAILVHQPVRLSMERAAHVDLRLEPSLSIAGKVVGPEGGGIDDVAVRIEGDRVVGTGAIVFPTPTWESGFGLEATRTDREGRFRFDSLYRGRFKVVAADRDDPDVTVEALVDAGSEEVVLLLDPAAAAKVSITGTVRNGLTGEPMRRFTINPMTKDPSGAFWGFSRSFTSLEGAFEIAGLEAGEIQLSARAPGFATQELAPAEYAAGTHRVDFTLLPERSFRLRVLHRDGSPVAGGSIQFTDANADVLRLEFGGAVRVDSYSLDAAGELTVAGLPAAILRVHVTPFGDPTSYPVDLDIRKEPTGVYEIRLESVPRPPPVHVEILLCGARESASLSEFQGEPSSAWLALLGPGREAWLLDAPATIVARDGSGREVASATLEPTGEGEWQVSESSLWGPSGQRSEFPAASLRLPPGTVEIEAAAGSGYRAERRTVDLRALPQGEAVVLFVFLRASGAR
jgi:protocatechuate 3,4-dioxygenase beta subunit